MSDRPQLERVNPDVDVIIAGQVYNRMCDLIEAGGMLSVAPPLVISQDPGGGRTIRINLSGIVAALKLTDVEDGTGFYKGRAFMGSARDIKDGNTDLELPGGMIDPGADNALAFDPNAANGGSSSLNPSTEQPIWVGAVKVGVTDENPPRGIFMMMGGSSLPVPEEEEMVLKAVAQNVLGADFVRGSPMLDDDEG